MAYLVVTLLNFDLSDLFSHSSRKLITVLLSTEYGGTALCIIVSSLSVILMARSCGAKQQSVTVCY